MKGKKIILTIDDMQENLTLMRSMLTDYFEVRLAKSAKMALALLETTQIDLILLDIEMPALSGFEFLRRLVETKSRNKDTPVIFVTSHADKDFLYKAISSGAKGYILKPVKAQDLYKKIDAVIGMPNEKFNPIEEITNSLIAEAIAGNSAKAESLVKELAHHSKDQNPQHRFYIEDIAKLIMALEYEKGIKRCKEFLVYISSKK